MEAWWCRTAGSAGRTARGRPCSLHLSSPVVCSRYSTPKDGDTAVDIAATIPGLAQFSRNWGTRECVMPPFIRYQCTHSGHATFLPLRNLDIFLWGDNSRLTNVSLRCSSFAENTADRCKINPLLKNYMFIMFCVVFPPTPSGCSLIGYILCRFWFCC